MPTLFALSKVIAAAVTVAGASFVSWRKYQLHPSRQSLYMRRKLEQTFQDQDVPERLKRLVKHSRGVETLFLKNFLNSAPTGPLLILGPAGGGQSVLLKEVTSGRHCCLFLDFKRNPVSSGEELVHMLCENAGYQFEVATLVSRFLLREGPRKNRMTAPEAEIALSLLSQFFQTQKENGWPLGVPVICLDDIYSIFGDPTFEKDVYFKKFTDWCLHLYDSKLAHVAFVSSHPMSEWQLNGITALKHKRTLVWINFPSTSGIEKFLVEEFDIAKPHFEALGKTLPNQLQIEWIVKCLGGHMEDLDHAISALIRGETFTTVLQRMIAESINFVEGYMEVIIKEAAGTNDPEAKARIQEKYMRFWRMLELLRDSQYVNRRDIANSIFKDYVAELDMYAQMEILCYLTRGTRPDLGETEFEKVDLEGAHVETVHFDAVAKRISSASPEEKKKEILAEREKYMLLGEGLGGWIVSAGSARIRIAFDNVLKHPRLVKQRRRIEDSLSLKVAKDKRQLLSHDKMDLSKERKMSFDEMCILFKDANNLKTCLGEDIYQGRLKKLMSTEATLDHQIEDVEKKLVLLTQEIQQLEAKFEENHEFEE